MVPSQATPISVSVAHAVAKWYNPASGVPEDPLHWENKDNRSLRVIVFEHSTFHGRPPADEVAHVSLTTLSSIIPNEMLNVCR